MDGPGASTSVRLARGAFLVCTAALTSVGAAALAVHAQAAPASLMIDVADCVDLASPGQRFDCYERHVEAAKAANRSVSSPAPQAGVVTAAPALSSPPSTAAASRAAAAAAIAAAPPQTPAPAHDSTPAPATTTSAASAPPPDAPPEIVSTVRELHETVPNAWLITLDNGQVWRQNVPQRFALKPGQRVTLRGTKWGAAYRLSADTVSGFIQVERVR